MISASRTVHWSLSAVAAASIFTFVLWHKVEAEQIADSRQAMVSVLSASGPHPSLGDQAGVWDRFVGTWDCEYTFFLKDGSVRHSRGELEFGWVMGGRAIQDVWMTYPTEAGKEHGIGTSLRFFDPKSKMWQVVFISPEHNAVVTVRGGTEGDRIVLRGVDEDGSMLRWSFNDIKADSFTWRGETSRDDGKTWKLEEEHHMKRRIADIVKVSTSQSTGPAEKPASTAAFQRLASLVGEWKGTQGKTEIKLTYTVTADRSVLMEECRAGKDTMVTMFTVDGDHLIATHYCTAGNQPQMVTPTITEPLAKSLTFSLSHVTGMKTPGDWHNTGLTLTIDDPQHLTQLWTYESNGKKGTNTFRFTRTL
jgi:hypothetical protein